MTQVYFTPHEREMALFYAERGRSFDADALAFMAREQADALLAAEVEVDEEKGRLEDEVEGKDAEIYNLEKENDEKADKIVALQEERDNLKLLLKTARENEGDADKEIKRLTAALEKAAAA